MSHNSRRSVLIAGLATFASPLFPNPLSAKGAFKGKIVTSWEKDGRTMTVEHPFEYLDSDGRKWPVPAGVRVDGASIPQTFWSFIGGPFEGLYRDASVVHDYYCQTRTRKDLHVHKVFHDAMQTSGVSDQKAWFMWKAVDRFGPRWTDPKIDPKCEIVDENYDFVKCARNSVRPPASMPIVSKSELQNFLDEVGDQASPQDKARLQQIISNSR